MLLRSENMKGDGRKTTKSLIIIASVLTICVVMLCAPAAYATPAYVVKEGRTAAALSFSTQGRALLTRADVTLNAPALPDKYGFDDDLLDTAVAEYTFSNVSDGGDTVTVLLQYLSPDYVVDDDTKKLSVEGEELELVTKYAPVSYGREDERIYAAALSSQYDPDADIPSDERVFIYEYDFDQVSGKGVKITVDGENAVFANSYRSTDGIYLQTKNGKFRLATVGKPYYECGLRFFYEGMEVNVSTLDLYVRETTLKEYFDSYMTDVDSEAREDLYACYVAKTARAQAKMFSLDEFFCEKPVKRDIAEFVVPAGESTVFRLAELFFPGIDDSKNPTIHISSVSVPNADRAEDFEMNINVITPYFVLNNSLFVKTENGYSYSSVGKNADTVFFVLCEEDDYSSGGYNIGPILVVLIMIIAIPILLIMFVLGIAVLLVSFAVMIAVPLAVVAGIVILIIWLCKRKKGKKKDDSDSFSP